MPYSPPNLDFKLIANEFEHLTSFYFNTAYFGPIPKSGQEKLKKALARGMNPSFYSYDEWIAIPEQVRGQIAQLLQCSPDHICHSTSVSDINSLVANGFDFKEGDKITALNKDFPSNILPWMVAEQNTPVTFELLDLKKTSLPTVEWLQLNLSPKTKIFAISYVAFETGKKVDILRIGKFLNEQDILFCVDATQALGGMSIDPEELQVIDVLSCAAYKWLLGPNGYAFAYFSPRALQKIKQTTGNWLANEKNRQSEDLLNYSKKDLTESFYGARKFDRGQTTNILTMKCLEGSFDLIGKLGLKNIESYNKYLRDYFLKNYPKSKYNLNTPEEGLSNIISLSTQKVNAFELTKILRKKNIDVSIRQGNVRLSFHFFNTTEQIDFLIEALDL